MADNDVVIVGAGPYGLGGAAQLRRAGVDVRVFGELMSFWQRHMPVGMFLRSSGIDGCEIGEGTGALTVSSFGKATGTELANPLPLETFVEYGRWYPEDRRPRTSIRASSRASTGQTAVSMLELLDGEVDQREPGRGLRRDRPVRRRSRPDRAPPQ